MPFRRLFIKYVFVNYEKEKIPYIRFKKFEQNWFMICLNKISKSIEYGLNASAKDFDGIHKYLRITDIDDASRLF